MKSLLYAISLGPVILGTGIAVAQDTTPEDDFKPPISIDMSEEDIAEKAETVVSSVNPLENDLRQLEIAIRMHNAFRIKPDGALFNLGVTDGSGIVRLDEEFVLIETFGIKNQVLETATKPDFYIRTYKLAEDDYARMQDAEAILQQLRKDSPGQNELKFNAQAKTCVEPSKQAPNTHRYTMFARTASDVDFISLFGEASIERGGIGVPDQIWSPCED